MIHFIRNFWEIFKNKDFDLKFWKKAFLWHSTQKNENDVNNLRIEYASDPDSYIFTCGSANLLLLDKCLPCRDLWWTPADRGGGGREPAGGSCLHDWPSAVHPHTGFPINSHFSIIIDNSKEFLVQFQPVKINQKKNRHFKGI